MPDWAWEAADLDGTTRALIVPRSATVTRRINGACTIALVAEGAAPELASTARIIRGYRAAVEGGARTLRATGKVAQIAAEGAADRLDRVEVQAVDGFGVLWDRHVIAPVFGGGLTFVQQTPRQIAHDVISDTAFLGDSFIFCDDAGDAAGPLRDRFYEPGKNAGEIIQQLAEVDLGFYFRCDPVDQANPDNPAGYVISELVLLHPEPGSDSTARFEYGEGTVGNLSAVQADVLPPINIVLAFGAGDGDARLKLTVADDDSIAEFGVGQAVINRNDVVELATLEKHALDARRLRPRRTFRVQVASSVGNPALQVPSPWDSFDAGDTVGLHLAGGPEALRYSGRALVTAFTVQVDADGIERLTGLDLVADD